MSSNTQRGNQLGPYQLGARYRNTGHLGRIYRAHSAETGAPALVVQRTGRQAEDAPLADWELRVTSSVSSSFLAVEVTKAPVGGDPLDVAGELVFMLEDAASAADTTINRPETMPHLLSARRPLPRASRATRPERKDWRRPALAAGMAALVAGLVLHAGGSTRPGLDTRDELARAADDAGWGGSAEVAADVVLTTMADEEPMVLARAMPKRPFSNQRRPPCDKQLEVELYGGCWVPHETRAPCPDRLYELGEKCYLPAAKPVTVPTAIIGRPLAFDRE